MIRINLIPVRQVKRRELGRQQLYLFGVLFLGGILANYFWLRDAQEIVDRKKAQVAKINLDLQGLDRAIGEVNSITTEKRDLEDKLKVLDTLKKKRVGPVKVLDALAQVIPAHVWLTDLSEKGGNVELQGLGMTNDDVAEFMRELKRSQYFSNIVLKRVTAQDTTGPVNQVVKFEISCTVSYAA
jgi:type IV pilus assembly protein PilN